MKMMFEVVYTVSAVIAAENISLARELAKVEFKQIVLDQSYESKSVEFVDIENWNSDYVPYGDNPKGLTIDQIETKNKLGWWL